MISPIPRAALVSGFAAMALTGCREEARQPEPLFVPAAAGADTYLPPLAPDWQDLPPAPPSLLRRTAYVPDYGYAERAYALDQAFYDAPPDYGVYGVEGEPWAWRSDDGYLMFAEPIDVGYRYYYYEPGHDYPFFVRTPDYGFGYGVGGLLVAIYAASGDVLPYDQAYVLAPRAGRYWDRARTLYSSALVRPEPVVYENWLARRPVLVTSREPWMRAAIREPAWRTYRERHASRELRQFVRERERRIEQVDRLERREIRQALRREDRVRDAAVERGRGHDRPPNRGEQLRVQREESAAQRFQTSRRSDQVRREREAMRHEQEAKGRREARIASIERDRGRGPQADRRPGQAVRDMSPPPQRVERPERAARVERARPERQQQAQARGQERPQERARAGEGRGSDTAAHERGGRPGKPSKD